MEGGSLNLVVIKSTRFFIPVSFKSRLSKVTTWKNGLKNVILNIFDTSYRYFEWALHIYTSRFLWDKNWWFPHTGDLQNQGITSNTGNINIISQFLLPICLILFQFTMSLLFLHTAWTFGSFVILVTSKIKALLQTPGTLTLFHNFSYRFVWFCFNSQCRYYFYILQELLVASSYWWPPKSRHYFKHREHQHYFTISLTDLFDFVSIHNVVTIFTYCMNFW